MGKKIVVISTSLRHGANSEVLADAFIRGAEDSGNEVVKITLYDKNINFCIGCLSCQETGQCILEDDVCEISRQMMCADILAFATPVYFYGMSGQMKTLLDRTNPLFPSEYSFREVCLLATAADEAKTAIDGTITGLQGWLDCFGKTRLSGVVRGTNAVEPGTIYRNDEAVSEAYTMGKLYR